MANWPDGLVYAMAGRETPFICEFCKLPFKRKSSLDAHIDSMHTRQRIYACTECDYSTSHVSHFRTHLHRHDNPDVIMEVVLRSIPNYCSICKKYFFRNHALTEHIALYHENVKPYSCEICDVEFKSLANYKRHMEKHATGESDDSKPDSGGKHVCMTCGAVFSRCSNLKEHMSTHVSPKDARRVFACTFEGCGSRFTRKSNLTTHMQTVHGGVQPHVCDVCGKDFRYPCLLAKHLEIHGKQEPEVIELTEDMLYEVDGRRGGLLRRVLDSANG